ncbi:HEAT repeat domain-containing protein [Leptospira semungkisensis]|uniref:HEAT repeat domain-containing protein n=1 Tax=Leptospira semungkisensis TaxID=2484985 RepID=A0A4R9G9N2_9LEPT|nr:HEAT repeat domain-containing protein [Leptospira semungkisensis]TGK07995.1 HEAT repeat domain-containing protein [Leptospira semungkisensis]
MQSRITFRLLLAVLLLALSAGSYFSPLFSQADPQPSSEQAPADPQTDPSSENAPTDPQPSTEKPKKPVVDKETKRYNEQFKHGLLKVFEAEANHRFAVLDKYGLTHPIPRVRAAAALALGRLGNKAGVKTIHKMIDRDGEYVRQAAYKGLADIGARASLDYFYAGAKSPDRDIRVYSFRGMGKTMDPGAREVLLKKGLTSDDKEIVKASILGLGYYQVPDDIRIFIDYLNSNDEDFQKAAVEALGRHKTRTSMKILEDSFAAKPNLRNQILDTLTEQKNSFAIFALLRILDANSNSEAIVKEISLRLYKLKAFGKYMTVIADKTPLMRDPYVGAQKIRDLEIGEVGKVLGKSSAAYIIPIEGKRIEDFYFKVLVNTKYKDAFTETVQGWVFGKYLQIRTISAPAHEKKKSKRPSILDDIPPAPQANPSADSDQNSSPQEDPNNP